MQYNKPALTIAQQIKQLQSRGLIIDDASYAEECLLRISYYRLSGYWWPMQADKQAHIFKPNSRFSDVMALYYFDRELRILLFDVIECIEIALRTKLVYYMSLEHGFWWFQKTELFTHVPELAKTLSALEGELNRSKDIFIKEHGKKYKEDFRFPPAIKTMELTSFGNLSKLYGNLKPSIKPKDIIAKDFNTVNHSFLPSWLQAIAQIRNICAHHGRLWNKNLPGRPYLLPRPPAPWLVKVPQAKEHHMLYIHVCCMKYLLDAIQQNHPFKNKLMGLLIKYPNVDLNALGFYPHWDKEPLWQNNC